MPGETDTNDEPVTISVVLTRKHLEAIDARVNSLGSNVSRSQYFSLVTERDIRRGGPLQIFEKDDKQAEPVELSPAAYGLMVFAIAEMLDYELGLAEKTALPKPPQSLTKLPQWHEFMEGRKEILKYKWIQSEKEGRDIGMERAVREWLQKYHAEWAEKRSGNKR
jgi:hypothetical protein